MGQTPPPIALSENNRPNIRLCNCRNPDICPMNGNCLSQDVMYEATVSSNLQQYQTRVYKGITKRIWKERYKEHKQAFRNPSKRTDSKLSEEIWRIKEAGGTPEVKWCILQKGKSYHPQARRCALCLTEKVAIAEHEGRDLLNKRSEIVAKCRHRLKYELSQLDSQN